MANCKIKRTYPMKNEIKNLETDFEVIYPNQKEIEHIEQRIQDKRDYLECISKKHPSYKFTIGVINELKEQLITLKNQ